MKATYEGKPLEILLSAHLGVSDAVAVKSDAECSALFALYTTFMIRTEY